MKRLYVGNLSFDSTESDVRGAFAAYGDVTSVDLVTDRETGRPRGFGFVEMSADQQAEEAVNALNGADLDGRALNVSEARPRPERRGPRW